MNGGILMGVVAALTLALAACGDGFQAGEGSGGSNTTTSTGSGAGGSTTSSGGGGDGDGGGSTTTSAGGGGGGTATGCGSTPPRDGAIFYVNFDSPADIANPVIGDGTGFQAGGGVDTVVGIMGDALRVDTGGEYASYMEVGSSINVDVQRGTLDFCFKPNFGSAVNNNFILFHVNVSGTGFLQVRKAALDNGNSLQVTAVQGGVHTETEFAAGDVVFVANEWVRVTVSWDYDPGSGQRQVHLFLDGVEIPPVGNPPTGPFSISASQAGQRFYIGGTDELTSTGVGLYDELIIYSTAITP